MLLVSFLCIFSCYALHKRDGITVATYEDALQLLKHDPTRRYLNEPLIITDSPMRQWTLIEQMENIFGPDYEVKVRKQTTDCSCFANSPIQYELCEQFGSSFLYAKPDNFYEHWSAFEAQDKQSSKYMHCVNKKSAEPIRVRQAIQYVNNKHNDRHFYTNNNIYYYPSNTSNDYQSSLNDINYVTNNINPEMNQVLLSVTSKQDSHSIYALSNVSTTAGTNALDSEIRQPDKKMHNYTKLYSYFEVFKLQTEQIQQTVTVHQLNFLDQIHLTPYFNIFSMRGFSDVENIHIWFGTEYYRAMRHYDKQDNLFFLLKGSRKFKLSAPTLNVFALHPFRHASSRHQMPFYSLLETYHTKEGTIIPDNYRIHEVEIYENELLYLPGYWFHEVSNNNMSVAMNIWWDCKNVQISRSVVDYRLPINPNKDDGFMLYELDAFFYYTQRLIESFCDAVKRNINNDRYILRCLNEGYRGYGFLTNNFRNMYRILDDLTYDNFEWMAIIMDIKNIIKCSQDRIHNYKPNKIREFKKDLYVCWDFPEEYKIKWDIAIDDVITMLSHQTSIGVSELVLQEYLENMLFALSDDAHILPIWIKMLKL